MTNGDNINVVVPLCYRALVLVLVNCAWATMILLTPLLQLFLKSCNEVTVQLSKLHKCCTLECPTAKPEINFAVPFCHRGLRCADALLCRKSPALTASPRVECRSDCPVKPSIL
ncbi:hypothetical protein BaRGS_00035304 [Batillaria attramentaria]|uniref:Uncharacterized protein n=1 Tax=Batillaria attramentaria TaxID=370345 RepID=A0ABD0JF22_9CAEN